MALFLSVMTKFLSSNLIATSLLKFFPSYIFIILSKVHFTLLIFLSGRLSSLPVQAVKIIPARKIKNKNLKIFFMSTSLYNEHIVISVLFSFYYMISIGLWVGSSSIALTILFRFQPQFYVYLFMS